MNANTISNLLWIAGTGGLFFWMMRGGGCGGGHRHGGCGGHQHADHGDDARTNPGAASPGSSHPEALAAVVDPVCRMPVESVKPELQRSFDGKTFHFCSPACLQKFDADPAKYARDVTATGTHRHAHGC